MRRHRIMMTIGDRTYYDSTNNLKTFDMYELLMNYGAILVTYLVGILSMRGVVGLVREKDESMIHFIVSHWIYLMSWIGVLYYMINPPGKDDN